MARYRVRLISKALPVLLLAAGLTGQAQAETLDIFDGSLVSARSRAMGGAFIPVADDASALYLNPAGLYLARGITLYGEYGDTGGSGSAMEARAVVVVPVGRFAFGGGYYRRKRVPDIRGEIFSLGGSLQVLEGAQGSFLSIGTGLKLARLSRNALSSCIPCGGGDDYDEAVSIDAGVMLRPLPMISIAYSVSDMFEPGFTSDYGPLELERNQSWGLAWIWPGSLTVCWQRKLAGGGHSDAFGFTLRTGSPLELMAGFSGDRVSGGVRWVQRRFDCLMAFSPAQDEDIYVSLAFQLYFRKKPDEIVQ